ncbi:hypothetical protein NKH36_11800 [Mesorhizobium sp. M1312]|uniref:hypothetical protein n=1 Tax=unclassified Mesorhizobium TaxID=325217 RepID=UPI003338A5F2
MNTTRSRRNSRRRRSSISSSSPEQVADAFQRWLEQRGSDGFVVNVSLPRELEVFAETVVPILQKRSIYRTEYESETFRGNLGITVPPNRYARNTVAVAAE